MPNNLEHQNINELLGAKDSLRLTILQINKDLGAFTSLKITESCESLEHLFQELKTIINSLSANNNQKLHGFVYRVDLKESVFIDYVKNNDVDIFVKEIIKREAFKIYLKSI